MMDAGAEKWLYKTAHKNFWRVSDLCDFDDLVQDGHMCYARVLMKYQRIPRRVRLTPHIMSLFQRTFLNHIHDMAKYRTRYSFQKRAGDLVPEEVDTEHDIWDHIADGIDVFDFEKLISEAPAHVARLLRAIMSAGSEFFLEKPYLTRRDGKRETTNERLCHLVGADPSRMDLATELREFLMSS
jgi:hypothetical protein